MKKNDKQLSTVDYISQFLRKTSGVIIQLEWKALLESESIGKWELLFQP